MAWTCWHIPRVHLTDASSFIKTQVKAYCQILFVSSEFELLCHHERTRASFLSVPYHYLLEPCHNPICHFPAGEFSVWLKKRRERGTKVKGVIYLEIFYLGLSWSGLFMLKFLFRFRCWLDMLLFFESYSKWWVKSVRQMYFSAVCLVGQLTCTNVYFLMGYSVGYDRITWFKRIVEMLNIFLHHFPWGIPHSCHVLVTFWFRNTGWGLFWILVYPNDGLFWTLTSPL